MKARWTGKGRLQVGIHQNVHTLAMLCDPYTLPEADILDTYCNTSGSWNDKCEEVLKKFYQGQALEDAKNELYHVVKCQGSWGDVVKKKQELVKIPVGLKFKSNVERVIWQQKKMTCTVGEWDFLTKQEFPLLRPVAMRLAVLAVQSADMERVCKVHKIVHSKARVRLQTKSVHQLLFSYANLRLLHKCTAEMGDFLLQMVD